MKLTRKQSRRLAAIGKRVMELYMLDEQTSQSRAEAAELKAEADAMKPPPPELPPGTGEFTMRRTPREETEDDRWRKVVGMRHGASGTGRNIYNPERDAARAAKVRDGREHVNALIRDRFNPWR